MGENMKRFDPRLWLGGLMILGGVLALLENLNIISEVGDVFWGLIWGGVGLYFLNRLITHKDWWAVFPAFALLGMAGSLLLPGVLEPYSGLVFFSALALAFLWVYFTDFSRWWAIIPAGVMLTLGTISVLDELGGMETGGMLFLGLGLTFILVAVLPGGRSRTWALIPGVILLAFGAVLGTPFAGFTQYLVPALLIVLGGYFVIRFFRSSTT
jgi:hypothetical protein